MADNMELKIGKHYVNKNKNMQFSDVVITKIYQKLDGEVKMTAPDNSWMQSRIEQYNSKPLSNIYICAEHIFNDGGEFDTTKEAFEQFYEPSREMSLKGRENDKHLQSHINSIFNAFLDGVYASGGDGSGRLLTKYYDFKELADLFGDYVIPYQNSDGTINNEKFRRVKDIYTRIDSDDHVCFTDMSNENFTIGPAFPSSKAHKYDDIFIVF